MKEELSGGIQTEGANGRCYVQLEENQDGWSSTSKRASNKATGSAKVTGYSGLKEGPCACQRSRHSKGGGAKES